MDLTPPAAPATVDRVAQVVASTLGLGDRMLTESTGLFGSMPELDSMAVVELVAALEDHFDVTLDEEDVTAEAFGTVGTLAALVDAKRG